MPRGLETPCMFNQLFTGKVKTIPKQISQFSDFRKRFSSEEFAESSQKLSRRNSDQSVKSDSSRMSNISDKINKVDISENMEISVGNDDTGNISISENVSDMSDSSKSELLEWIAEMKRKPVQVNIENKEFTISPQNKSKISDKLMKKLALTGENSDATETNPAVEAVKKQIATENVPESFKTQTDLLLEKYETQAQNEDEQVVVEQVYGAPENDSQIHLDNIEPQSAKKIIFGEDVDYSTVKINLPVRDPVDTEATSSDEGKDSVATESANHTEVNSVTNSSEVLVPKTTPKSSLTSKTSLTDSNEDGYNGELLEDTQIDEANIRNIIHSSLNELPRNKIEEVRNSFKNVSSELSKEQPESNKELENDKNAATSVSVGGRNIEAVIHSKKRKLSSDANDSTQSKDSKIMKTSEHDKQVEKVSTDSILLRELQTKKEAIALENRENQKANTSISNLDKPSTVKDTLKIVPLVEIKSEPCSEDEFCETDDMEAKRELLSALNITEKITDPATSNKKDESGSTSKEAEKNSFKVVDNLTQVIDKVASTYSQEHEGEEITLKSTEKRKEIYIKPLSKMQASPLNRQKARKSFTTTPSIKRTYENLKKDVPTTASSNNTSKTVSSEPQTSTSLMFLTQPQSVMISSSMLPPNQQITYTPNMGNPILTMVQHPLNAFGNILLPQNVNVVSTPVQGTAVPQDTENSESQNYIPQSGASTSKSVTSTTTTTRRTDPLNSSALSDLPSLAPISVAAPPVANSNTDSAGQTQGILEEFGVLKDVIPESVAKAVNEMLSRPLPKLKPRPPSAVCANFDEGVPSSAGPVASKINSFSHRVSYAALVFFLIGIFFVDL